MSDFKVKMHQYFGSDFKAKMHQYFGYFFVDLRPWLQFSFG